MISDIKTIDTNDINNDINNDMELDDAWIKEIDAEESIYKKFYSSSPSYVNLCIIYLDNSSNIIHIKIKPTSLTNNTLNKAKLIYYISKYALFHETKYKCLDILKYNVNVGSKSINKFLENPDLFNYLSNESKIDDIYWENSVEMLHCINTLYILYKPVNCVKNTKHKHKNKEKHKYTRKKFIANRKKTRKTVHD